MFRLTALQREALEADLDVQSDLVAALVLRASSWGGVKRAINCVTSGVSIDSQNVCGKLPRYSSNTALRSSLLMKVEWCL
jgi:hypothetical protein